MLEKIKLERVGNNLFYRGNSRKLIFPELVIKLDSQVKSLDGYFFIGYM